ncbi:MAG: pentapeptide repeat-containing protein [Cyanobacteria bacterium P01_D01_bin.36]
MKSRELLKLYREGRFDFSGEVVRGQSFARQSLEGIILKDADIRGANFTDAILIGADLKGVRTGTQRRWATVIVIGLLILLALSSFPFSLAFWWLPYYFLPNIIDGYTFLPGLLVSAAFLSFFCIIAYQPLETALGTIAGVGAIMVASTAITGVGGAVDISLAIAITMVSAAVGPASAALAGAAAVTAVRIIAGTKVSIVVVIFAAVATGALSGASSYTIVSTGSSVAGQAMLDADRQLLGTALASTGGILSVLLSGYISCRTLSGDENYELSRKLAGVMASVRGTSFRGTDLTGADFTEADLKGADFRKANLTHTCWYVANRLSWTRPGESYLRHRTVRNLITRRKGEGKSFDNFDLQGVNLENAKLSRVSFKGANLENAILRNADLEGASFIGANLNNADLQYATLCLSEMIQTQLDRTDLREADLTAAYIEDWNITTETQLGGVFCRYVYMRFPHPDDHNQDRRRKPDDPRKEFKKGEFSDFIYPMVKTLDLYHNQDIDPRVVSLAIKDLHVNNPNADIKLASIERKGEKSNILVRLATSEEASHPKLGAEYSDSYDSLSSLSSEELADLLNDSSPSTQIFANLIAIAAKKGELCVPVNNNYFFGGIDMSESNKQLSISGGSFGQFIGGDAAIDGIVNLGTISGNVTNSINQLPDSVQLNGVKLRDVLAELKEAISDESLLSNEDKAEALEQLGEIAEAGKKTTDGAMKIRAKKATTMLKGIVSSLPDVTRLAEACNKLIPMIFGIFGLS